MFWLVAVFPSPLIGLALAAGFAFGLLVPSP